MATTQDGTGKMVGAQVKRVEDPRVLLGQGEYVDDIQLPDMAAVAFVRSPYAHARINQIDTTAAKSHPGVITVLTGADVAEAIKPLRVEFDAVAVPDHRSRRRPPSSRP